MSEANEANQFPARAKFIQERLADLPADWAAKLPMTDDLQILATAAVSLRRSWQIWEVRELERRDWERGLMGRNRKRRR